MKKLTHKQALFVQEFLVDMNGTQAAIRAGYSRNTAQEIASENLSKPIIANAIEEAMAERLRRTQADADGVLKRLLEIDQLDLRDLFDETGKLKAIREWPDSWCRSISAFEIKMSTEEEPDTAALKIKLPDKLKNLELIGRHAQIGAFRENSDAKSSIEDLIDELTN
ncbi:terminase small subunit [uncultured Microbulbifer sp.]|uniref:terminase small subunit n=1 Tax=uncultured Microbulbifer sp. TaxID=348147 RepID=UPI0025D1FE2E|nr:terminase small subunit [uncultured Microbulbifer sp.]